MDADFSVELGPDDPTLAVPWRSPDGAAEFVDLRLHPESLETLSEVRSFPELADFLTFLNRGIYSSAKCDAWFDQLMDVNDEPYGAKIKCASYVDVFFGQPLHADGFDVHETRVREIITRLRSLNDISGRMEIIIRRAYFGDAPGAGLYWTIYAFGYGDSLDTARENWRRTLALIQATLAAASAS